jgi:hypothetical protein
MKLFSHIKSPILCLVFAADGGQVVVWDVDD